ncbi:interleukin-12 subunit alpha, partial [Rhinoderma darwinii]|uniref:interleukin-12 subunit alpha n=1 Tax=Rhinoderma darwinii TaxID=43563 RepID=UPI003F6667E1
CTSVFFADRVLICLFILLLPLLNCGCHIIWILLVIGQSLVVETKPVHQPIDLVRCYNISRNLVNVVTDAILKLQNDLHGVLNCSYGVVAIEDVTANTMNTVKACLPSMNSQTCICSQMNRTEIDEDKCLTAIYSDLKLFMKQLHELNPSLDKTVTDMMQALKVQDKDKEHGEKIFSSKSHRHFKQCTVIHYFQLRAITISRVFSQLTGGGTMLQKELKR